MHMCVHMLFTRSLAGTHCCDLYLTDRETEAQRGQVSCCQSHSSLSGATWPRTKPSGYRDCVPSAQQCCLPCWRLLCARHPRGHVSTANSSVQVGLHPCFTLADLVGDSRPFACRDTPPPWSNGDNLLTCGHSRAFGSSEKPEGAAGLGEGRGLAHLPCVGRVPFLPPPNKVARTAQVPSWSC